jgi:hypothetical protein
MLIVLVCFMLINVITPSSPIRERDKEGGRERERGREGERERGRERERVRQRKRMRNA